LERTVCLPVVVRVRERKTREPVVKVHFYSYPEDEREPFLEFRGVGYMSWHSAIVLANCSHLGVKIALPNRRWARAELVADVIASPDGKEHGRGLRLDMESLPGCAQEWAGSFSSIFDLPLSEDRENPEYDWTCGFPPSKKKSKRSKGT